MSQSFNCKCPERSKPIADRAWSVVARNVHHSRFNGGHATYTDYSEVRCSACGCIGRTKAKFVSKIKNAPPDWFVRT